MAYSVFRWEPDPDLIGVLTPVEGQKARPKRVFETSIEDAVDAVDIASAIFERDGLACHAEMNPRTMLWYVIED